MVGEILDLEIDSFQNTLEEIRKAFDGVDIFKDNIARSVVKSFFDGLYRLLTEETERIESTLDLSSNSVDYKSLKKTTEKLKEFLEKYKEIFIAAGITNEDKVNDKVKILKEKEIIISKFLTR